MLPSAPPNSCDVLACRVLSCERQVRTSATPAAPAQELMGELSTATSQRYRVWAVDLLGQGRSWPQRTPEPHHRLAFSVDTWTEQIADFIR